MDEPNFVTFSVRMPETLKERIEVIAKGQYNSRNGMICLAVEQLLQAMEAEEKPAPAAVAQPEEVAA